MKNNTIQYDAVIIGGSYAGLSAAMGLGRARRQVLVIDSGAPCNKQTPHSHNFLTQDGNTPAGIAAIAREQVLRYPTITIAADTVIAASGTNNDFTLSLAGGEEVFTRKLLFATGIRDIMPEIPGFADCWGISAIHCPYCHGYEYSDQPTGILANGEAAADFGLLIRNWTAALTIFTNGYSTIPEASRIKLEAQGIGINENPVLHVVHDHGQVSQLDLGGGDYAKLNALYARLPFIQHCTLPAALGCELDDKGYLKVNELQSTTVEGIYAAGDNTSPMRAVAAAVAAGAKAAAMLNHELVAGK